MGDADNIEATADQARHRLVEIAHELQGLPAEAAKAAIVSPIEGGGGSV